MPKKDELGQKVRSVNRNDFLGPILRTSCSHLKNPPNIFLSSLAQQLYHTFSDFFYINTKVIIMFISSEMLVNLPNILSIRLEGQNIRTIHYDLDSEQYH